MDENELTLALYVNKASDLAELLRHDLQHNNGIVSNKTVLALNAFIIAANQIKDLTDVLEQDAMKRLN